MKLSNKALIQGLLFSAPIVLGSTIAIAPSRAASLSIAGATLTLENFNIQGNSLFSNTDTSTNAISSPGSSAEALAPLELNTAIATPNRLDQTSFAAAQGSGPNYLATAKGTSETALQFDVNCGCLRFDFSGALLAFAGTDTPNEQATATSFLAFYIFNNNDLNNPIDSFEASLSTQKGLNLLGSSKAVVTDSIFDELGNSFTFNGYYTTEFAEGTQLTVRGITRSEALVKAGSVSVPEPSAILALGVVPGLLWWKRRSQVKAAQS